MNLKLMIIVALLLPALATAEITPRKGDYDPRVRIVDYNPLNVVKLSTFYGVSTHVKLDESETISDVAIGDENAWVISPRGNNIFIKPKAEQADTNLTIVTNKRIYQFALIVQPRPIKDTTAWANPNVIFSLAFRYPDDEKQKRKLLLEKQVTESVNTKIKTSLTNAKHRAVNYDYWVAGSEEISPTSAKDDNRFIYLSFANNRDMPAIYAVDDTGHESLINTNVIDKNTIVIHRLVPKLMLRKGDYVASVINKSFDINGGSDNITGTIATGVERIIKEPKQQKDEELAGVVDESNQ